ncbi:MAG: hypothetical protein M3R44_04400 [Candidatus Eremiobacteraeota bacterium]|nr:hypothetical protein [Candidatus Eremiobacteraeota bacterium]
MNERNEAGRPDPEKTVGEELDEQQTFLQNAFNLSPETAKVTAEDTLGNRRREPASDRVEDERVAAASEQNARQDAAVNEDGEA